MATATSLVQAWRCPPTRLPVLTLAPLSSPPAHTARGTRKKQIRFFPSSTQNPTRLLSHSKQEPVFPKAYKALHSLALAACGPCPLPLSPCSFRLSHTGLLASANHHRQFCPRALALAALPARNTLPPDSTWLAPSPVAPMLPPP